MPIDVSRGVEALFFDVDDCVYQKKTSVHVWVRSRIVQRFADILDVPSEEAHDLVSALQAATATCGCGGGHGEYVYDDRPCWSLSGPLSFFRSIV